MLLELQQKTDLAFCGYDCLGIIQEANCRWYIRYNFHRWHDVKITDTNSVAGAAGINLKVKRWIGVTKTVMKSCERVDGECPFYD